MKEITIKDVKEKDLKLIGRSRSSDFSKMILLMERVKEDKRVLYYLMDYIMYNENTQKGEFIVSFWG